MRLARSAYGRTKVIVAITLISLAGLTLVMAAADEEAEAGGIPLPSIPGGQGENCVEDTDFMRRNHMDLLLHQRDDTVLQGIRSKQHSLRECIDCHAVHGEDGRSVTVTSPKHFCRSCHDYAAVNIDCFQCHASRPGHDDAAIQASHK